MKIERTKNRFSVPKGAVKEIYVYGAKIEYTKTASSEGLVRGEVDARCQWDVVGVDHKLLVILAVPAGVDLKSLVVHIEEPEDAKVVLIAHPWR
jgi:hypothetical protein